MNSSSTQKAKRGRNFLSIGYKANGNLPTSLNILEESVIITNTQFVINSYNKVAEVLFGLSANDISEKILSNTINFKFANTTRAKVILSLFKTGEWSGATTFFATDKSEINFLSKAVLLSNNTIVITNKINDGLQLPKQTNTENNILNELVQKQKLISQAAIEAQEKERSMISAELHDNVNQLLMSAKLHIGAAKNNDNQDELLDNASKYLLQAVEEIRSLSKRLNTSIIKVVGLHDSIMDISRNMKLFNDIDVTVQIDKKVIEKLSHKQQLVIYRIIQEQSNNITKYSRASAAAIVISEKNNHCQLLISDNGIGFDKEKQKPNGIGLINMFNRVDAYSGTMEIVTYPDNGCTINIALPYLV